eukprot:s2392_g1.t1
MANQNGEEFLVQRSTTYRRGAGGGGRAALVNAVDMGTDEMDEERSGSVAGDAGEESYDEDVPIEVIDAEKEAYAMQYRAKQRMAEARKMRQYYRKDKDPEERKKALAEKMKNTHCHNCGELGHWSRECPKSKSSPVYGANYAASYGTEPAENKMVLESMPGDSEWDLLVSLCTGQGPCAELSDCQAYMVLPSVDRVTAEVCSTIGVYEHEEEMKEGNKVEVLWCIQELAGAVILDLGCLKSVAGTKWVNHIISRWRQQGWWFRIDKANETFRFGSGSTLDSRFSIQFVATFAGKLVILSFSVVKGDCPPLFSRPACSQLGAVFDCGKHTLSSNKLGVKSYGMSQTASGHYIMNIDEFDKLEYIPDIPADYSMDMGKEVVIWHIESYAAETFGSGAPGEHSVANLSDVEGSSSTAVLSHLQRSRSSRGRMPSPDDRRGGRSTPAPSEPDVIMTRPKSAAKARASGSTRSGQQPEIFNLDDNFEITEEERRILANRREKMKATEERKKHSKALTGSQANYPSLSHTWSRDVGLNIAGSVRSRMVTFCLEEVPVDVAGQDCGGEHFQRCKVEAKSSLVGQFAGDGSGEPFRPLWRDEAAAAKSEHGRFDVMAEGGGKGFEREIVKVSQNAAMSAEFDISDYERFSQNDKVSQNVAVSDTNEASAIFQEPRTNLS